jgi:hypothetical protein
MKLRGRRVLAGACSLGIYSLGIKLISDHDFLHNRLNPHCLQKSLTFTHGNRCGKSWFESNREMHISRYYEVSWRLAVFLAKILWIGVTSERF